MTDTVYTVSGQDWDSVTDALSESGQERIVVNMGPQHPSTHGVLRLILELDGETVTECRLGIGYLHTGIEKNCEYRTWTQGVTFVTRMDYLAPLFNEYAYVHGVERLLGIEDQIPERANVIRVMLMELNRIASHLVAIATGGMELGALTAMTFGFRERELILDVFEMVTGLRMNHAYFRPGGVSQDLPHGAVDRVRDLLTLLPKRLSTPRSCWWATRSGPSARSASATSTSLAAWRWASPDPSCARPVSRTTSASPSRMPVTRPTSSTCRPSPPAMRTAAS
jgi:NADH-quinone oxidoreductase subunit D